MIAMEEKDLNEEIENDYDDNEEYDDETQTDNSDLQEEVERLRKQNEKLKLKKRKAIETSTKKAVLYDDLERFYQTKKQQETFERDYP
jgi:hypothetical protein